MIPLTLPARFGTNRPMKRQMEQPAAQIPAIAPKGERQAAFIARAKADGLSNEQIVRRAAFVPFGKPIKVLSWPSL